ncbi:MAG TPA: hypothetical protein VN783_00745, partial [Thermoanaerobaculia bacterium]|nr:hypothetical protein [Thermoanaerobaculia bacterium]
MHGNRGNDDSPARPARRAPPARRRLAVAALGVALALHAALFALDRLGGGRRLWGDEITYVRAAERLLATGRSDLDPLWPPLYPHALAALGASLPAAAAAQSLLLLAAALLLADLARRWYGGRAGDVAGFVAGWLLLADPQVAAFAHYLWPEVLHLVLFLAAVRTLAWVEERSSGGPGAGEGEDGAKAAPFAKVALGLAVASLALGLALQAKSLLLPFLPLLLLPVLRGQGARRAAARAALVLLVTAATSAPALVANHRAGYGWTLPDSSRFNLWVGLNDTSRRNLVGEIVGTEYERYRASAPAPPERNAILGGK